MRIQFLLFIGVFAAKISAAAVPTVSANNLCNGANALLALIDRPSIQDSPCAVAPNHVLVEAGYQHASLNGGGSGDNFPQMELRFGVPHETEVDILPPNYYYQAPAGFGAWQIGLKHELIATANSIWTLDSLAVLPSGGMANGSAGIGLLLSGIASFSLTDTLSFTGLLGVISQTESVADGGQRVGSLYPDVLIAWQPKDKFQLFGEVYAQTRTSPDEGVGCSADAGIQYLLLNNVEIDAEAGVSLVGHLGGYHQFIGVGGGIYF